MWFDRMHLFLSAGYDYRDQSRIAFDFIRN